MRHVLLTAASTPLARRLAPALRERGEVEAVWGIDSRASSGAFEGMELVQVPGDQKSLIAFLAERRVDSVIHCGLAPGRSGRPGRTGPADVIATMRLCAALSHPELSVRSLVVVSSSAIYPVRTHTPLFRREDSETGSAEREPAASLLEAEGYVRDLATRAPHVCVAILRLAELAGAGIGGALSSALTQRRAPAPLGFDPAVQFLHVDDAVRALVFAAEIELAGVHNVASRGVIRWSEAVRVLGRRSVPVVPFETGPLQPLLRALRISHLPEGTGPVLRFGSALDVSKLEAAGWKATHDQTSCLAALAAK
jgi:UDP-glucose 4-epimerase